VPARRRLRRPRVAQGRALLGDAPDAEGCDRRRHPGADEPFAGAARPGGGPGAIPNPAGCEVGPGTLHQNESGVPDQRTLGGIAVVRLVVAGVDV
jgi:hypothetical protein